MWPPTPSGLHEAPSNSVSLISIISDAWISFIKNYLKLAKNLTLYYVSEVLHFCIHSLPVTSFLCINTYFLSVIVLVSSSPGILPSPSFLSLDELSTSPLISHRPLKLSLLHSDGDWFFFSFHSWSVSVWELHLSLKNKLPNDHFCEIPFSELVEKFISFNLV